MGHKVFGFLLSFLVKLNNFLSFFITGIHHGGGVELEKLLGRKLVWLPCRHHVMELVIKCVFEVYWPTQSGPNVQVFSRFKDFWKQIDKLKYDAGINDPTVADVLSDEKDQILAFINSYSQVCKNRIIFIKTVYSKMLSHCL